NCPTTPSSTRSPTVTSARVGIVKPTRSSTEASRLVLSGVPSPYAEYAPARFAMGARLPVLTTCPSPSAVSVDAGCAVVVLPARISAATPSVASVRCPSPRRERFLLSSPSGGVILTAELLPLRGPALLPQRVKYYQGPQS